MSDHPVKRRKKLIEVAIPLEAINAASAREKSIRHGHPSTLHLWWARRPLAAARAVIFCQMVDDPSAVPEEFPTEEAQENERLRLFALISELVTWENTTNEQVLNRAREEIRRSWRRCCSDNADHPEAAELFNPEKLPGFHDPFAGGGALPLEAQRLGLEACASDLNPVAVLINKAMIEIPPKFAGMPPVNPESRSKQELIKREWKGAQGLADDVRYYGQWMRDEAEKRIGHLYPKVLITSEMVNDPENPRPDLKPYEGQELTVIAWLWARTVKCPNPACRREMPLISSFQLSAKKGNEWFIVPSYESGKTRFTIRSRWASDSLDPKKGYKRGNSGVFACADCGTVTTRDYVANEALNRGLGSFQTAVVAEGDRCRVYLDASVSRLPSMQSKPADSVLDLELSPNPRDVWCRNFGLLKTSDLFTDRQLIALTTFSDLVGEAMQLIRRDAIEVGIPDDSSPLRDGGSGATAYAEAVGVYLGFAIGKLSDNASTVCSWHNGAQHQKIRATFSRQALPMTWDFAEGNVFSVSTGNFMRQASLEAEVIERSLSARSGAQCMQADAHKQNISAHKLVSTDPPYYDNIGYADLSDFFYVWLRRSLRIVFPDLFATLAVPKAEELVATPYRHGGKEQAEIFFLNGMTQAMHQLAVHAHAGFPLTIYYAFKQSETKGTSGAASTGWETFLAAVMKAGLAITGTWPMRTELANRMIGAGTNALASSVVLVCQRRDHSAAILSRNEFRRELRQRLPQAIKELEHANIAPVDVAQAAIGPGMAIFSQAKAVLNPDDSTMSVRDALIEINAALDEHLSQDEGAFDADTRFALTFFESHGYSERPYGDAEGLAVARNISVQGVASAGILSAIAGKVQLLRREQLDDEWDPTRDDRLCVWEATQHLIKRLEAGGEASAAELLGQLKKVAGHGDLAANCRALAYRLYNHCEKTKQAEEGRAYNGLVIAWQEIERQASNQSTETAVQTSLI
jgi:putative DNA methylase